MNGLKLWEFANGMDVSRVCAYGYAPPIKSVSHGITCTQDLYDNTEVKNVLLALAPRVSKQLREAGFMATGVQVSVRDSELVFKEFQCRLPYPTQSSRELVEHGMELFRVRYQWQKPVRAVCIRAINLLSGKIPIQLDLFDDHAARNRQDALERAVEGIRRRYGDESIIIASAMNAKLKRDKAREMLIMPAAMYV